MPTLLRAALGRWMVLSSLMVAFASTAIAQKLDRNAMVLADRARVLNDGYWIYNDVDAGLAKAQGHVSGTTSPRIVVTA